MAQCAAAVHWLIILSGTHLHKGGVEQRGTIILAQENPVGQTGNKPGTSRPLSRRPNTELPLLLTFDLTLTMATNTLVIQILIISLLYKYN